MNTNHINYIMFTMFKDYFTIITGRELIMNYRIVVSGNCVDYNKYVWGIKSLTLHYTDIISK